MEVLGDRDGITRDYVVFSRIRKGSVFGGDVHVKLAGGRTIVRCHHNAIPDVYDVFRPCFSIGRSVVGWVVEDVNINCLGCCVIWVLPILPFPVMPAECFGSMRVCWVHFFREECDECPFHQFWRIHNFSLLKAGPSRVFVRVLFVLYPSQNDAILASQDI